MNIITNMSQITGEEKFYLDDKETKLSLKDFWQYQYHNIYNLQQYIAEYIVGKALGLERAQNTEYWTLYDILYRNTRIEIKETSYYHPWNEGKKVSHQRMFSIAKANSSYEDEDVAHNRFERQNDIYVFCVLNGETREESYPLELNNWEFYIVPTTFINENCGDNKKISLGRIRKFGFEAKRFDQVKITIDEIIGGNYICNKLEK